VHQEQTNDGEALQLGRAVPVDRLRSGNAVLNMWNVFMIDSGECERVNSEPYDLKQIADLLTQLAELDEPVGNMLITSTRPITEQSQSQACLYGRLQL
jgi:hypothetical protein